MGEHKAAATIGLGTVFRFERLSSPELMPRPAKTIGQRV
jgi:hypothetical protein